MNEALHIAGLEFEVRRSQRRKTLGLTVDRAGELVVSAPADTSEAVLREWVSKKLLWVHQKLAQKQALAGTVHPPEFVSGESIFYLGCSYRLKVVDGGSVPLAFDGQWFLLRRADQSSASDHFQRWFTHAGALWLRDRIAKLEARSGQPAADVVIGDLGFRWGSCGKNRVLYFNWRLLQLAVRLIDYVILHEQMHLLHHNHSPDFWRALDRILPDWRERKEELETDWGRYARFALAPEAHKAKERIATRQE